jgi:hypothetical protein
MKSSLSFDLLKEEIDPVAGGFSSVFPRRK